MIDRETKIKSDAAENQWPFAMGHLENSKLTPHTASWRTDAIREYTANLDAMLEASQTRKLYPGANRMPLDKGRLRWGPSLWKVLAKRRTVREFSSRPIPWSVISTLIHSAAGITGFALIPNSADIRQNLRAWPSGGGLYPLELYPVLLEGPHAGAYHYDPVDSVLECLKPGHLRDRIRPHILTIAQELDAPLLFLLSGRLDRTMKKYGERGYRFVWLEAGHLAQNLILASVAKGLSTCPLGGFHDDAIRETLSIDNDETILYAIAVGFPNGNGRSQL